VEENKTKANSPLFIMKKSSIHLFDSNLDSLKSHHTRHESDNQRKNSYNLKKQKEAKILKI
jgi:hypothetical protein